MQSAKLRLSAVAIAAILIATIVVSPAVGGPSLKPWVKQKVVREVSKQLRSKVVSKQIARQVKRQLRRKTGLAGPAGPAGPTGADGVAGAGGAGASGIVVSASLAGPAVSSGGQGVAVPIPLTDASWTQAGGEIDEVYAEVTHSGLDAGCFGGVDSGSALITIELPGGEQISLQVSAGEPAGTISTSQPTVVMPSLAGAHTLTAFVSDTCVGPENTTVTGIDIYVVATS